MECPPHRPKQPIVLALEDPFGQRQGATLLVVAKGVARLRVEALAVSGPLLVHVEQVGESSEQRPVHAHFGAFLFQEAMHVKIPRALGDLSPELAHEPHDRLHPEGVQFDFVVHRRDCGHLVHEIPAGQRGEDFSHEPGVLLEGSRMFKKPGKPHKNLFGDTVHRAFFNFIGAKGVKELIHDISNVEGVDHAEEEVQICFEARLLPGALVEAVVSSEQDDPKAVEPRMTQGEPILGLVHAESAGSARPCGHEDVPGDDVLAAQAGRLKILDVLHQVSHGEVRGIAQAVVPVFFRALVTCERDVGEGPRPIAEALQDSFHQPVVSGRQPAKQHRGVRSLRIEERVLNGAVVVP